MKSVLWGLAGFCNFCVMRSLFNTFFSSQKFEAVNYHTTFHDLCDSVMCLIEKGEKAKVGVKLKVKLESSIRFGR